MTPIIARPRGAPTWLCGPETGVLWARSGPFCRWSHAEQAVSPALSPRSQCFLPRALACSGERDKKALRAPTDTTQKNRKKPPGKPSC